MRLIVVAVGLPLYWLNEPARQSGAEENFLTTFEARGEELYVEGSQCQSCHGPQGTGRQATYTITDADGAFGQDVQLLGTPATLIVDADGAVRRQLTGELTEQQLRAAVDDVR